MARMNLTVQHTSNSDATNMTVTVNGDSQPMRLMTHSRFNNHRYTIQQICLSVGIS